MTATVGGLAVFSPLGGAGRGPAAGPAPVPEEIWSESTGSAPATTSLAISCPLLPGEEGAVHLSVSPAHSDPPASDQAYDAVPPDADTAWL